MRNVISRRRSPVAGLIAVLVFVLAVDLASTFVSYLAHRDAPPYLPTFESDSADPVPGVDAYRPLPTVYDFQITSGPGLEISDEGSVRRIVDGAEYFDPDSSLRYALAALARARGTSGGPWLDRAETSVREVLDHSRDGLALHGNPATDAGGRQLPANWVSASTQGLLLSALARLYEATGSAVWRETADHVFDTYLRIRGIPDEDGDKPEVWISLIDDGGHLWFEEQPQAAGPSLFVTGHVFALFGLYDYIQGARGGRAVAGRRLFAAGVTTASMAAATVRFPYFAARSSPASEERDSARHRVLVAQLETLEAMTGRKEFARLARAYAKDIELPEFFAKDYRPVGNVDAYSERRLPATLPPLAIPGSDSKPNAVDQLAVGALTDLAEYSRTGAAAPLADAERIVDRLLRSGSGGFVPHRTRSIDVHGAPVSAPWYSAQTQGLLLSALTRLAEETGEDRWRRAADRVFGTFEKFQNGQGSHVDGQRRWTAVVGDDSSYGNLWFERFAQPGPATGEHSLVVTAHIAGLFGIYDYWRLTGDTNAERLFNGGATTLVARLDDIREPGKLSRLSLAEKVRSVVHHRVLIEQLDLLTRMTGRTVFLTYAAQLAGDQR